MTPPKISVCIPAYNRVEVLPDLLDSVLAQDYDDYEVVIVDDCSPQREEIRAVIERYAAKSPRIRYFENERNLGYDANNDKYVDMFKAGIVDPLRVTRSALQNAASIAGLMLTTEVMVTKIDEDDKKSRVSGAVA